MNNLRPVTRWLLIAGVMVGLFFSGGEGIRLLPFPAVSAAGEAAPPKLENGKSNSYSYTVRNSAAHSFAIKFKEQKNPKFFESAGPGRIGGDHQPLELVVTASRQNYRQPAFFNYSPVTAVPSDRAPPAI